MPNKQISKILAFGAFALIFISCNFESAATQTATPPIFLATPSALPPTVTPTPQALSAPALFAPDNLPKDYNPLTAQIAKDPALLQMPALLISVSHFPPVARPQAGLSFASWVFEFYITEGATRFLSVFYGGFPSPEIPVTGACEVRHGVFAQTSASVILGNRVWLDENQNGRQESYERGIGGVCVNLFDADGKLLQSTTSDSNGYYGFNVQPAQYAVEFVLPEWLQFTKQNIGDENLDSDPDPVNGKAEADARLAHLFLDAGLILRVGSILPASPSAQLPKGEVGPVRSGRLLYADIADFFHGSCLIYAFASAEVLDKLPQCSMVAHEDAGGGSMMSLERMKAVAEDHARRSYKNFNYASNTFAEEPPVGGASANQINVYVSTLNQSGWTYDPLYGSWLRFVDNADPTTAGQLHADVDRLTGRQLHFENFIILNVDHDVISPTNLDIHLEQGLEGSALLFRDGMKYDIRWTTKASDYEKNSGTRQPMRFINLDGSPAALKPGNTWLFVSSPYSIVSDEGTGAWKLRYYPPAGSK